jgi:trehalose/maltose hydrolase-like predicted phosphorylase
MAAWTLRRAATLVEELPHAGRRALFLRLSLSVREIDTWRRVAARLRLVFHADGALSQFDGFERLRPLDLAQFADRASRLDLALAARNDDVNAYQVAKQADVLMLLHLLGPAGLTQEIEAMGYRFTAEQMRLTVSYYAARTAHDSSLSLVGCAGALAPFDPDASWGLFCRAMAYDREPGKRGTVGQGVHLGVMAGVFDVLTRIYLGLEHRGDELSVSPNPPRALAPLRLGLGHRGAWFTLAWDGTEVQLHAEPGNAVTMRLRLPDTAVALVPGGTVHVHVPTRSTPVRPVVLAQHE